MTTSVFIPAFAGYEARVRESFARQGAMKLIGAAITEVAPGLLRDRARAATRALAAARLRACGHRQRDRRHAPAATPASRCFRKTRRCSPSNSSSISLAPAKGERIVAEGFVVKPGRTLAITRGEVHAEEGGKRTLVALMQQTLMVMHGKPGSRSEETRHARIPVPLVQPRRNDRPAARDGAAVRGGRDRAARRSDRPHQHVSARPVAQDGRPGPARHHGRGGVRRHRDGLSRALRRDGGDLARARHRSACRTARTRTCA